MELVGKLPGNPVGAVVLGWLVPGAVVNIGVNIGLLVDCDAQPEHATGQRTNISSRSQSLAITTWEQLIAGLFWNNSPYCTCICSHVVGDDVRTTVVGATVGASDVIDEACEIVGAPEVGRLVRGAVGDTVVGNVVVDDVV